MNLVHTHCAGLDIGKSEVVAAVRIATKREAEREVRRFGTTTRALLELRDWLKESGCTHVAMEATGVYWRPIWHLLEGEFELILANPAHIKNVPGRKSDVKDSEWIADLLAHGLIRSSFIPPRPIQELRELTRTRRQLGREIVRHTQRIQAVLENANIKLDSVVSELLGVSGRRMLEALAAGETNPEVLASLAAARLECPTAKLIEALRGRVTDHHRFLLQQHLHMIAEVEASIKAFDHEIAETLRPFRLQCERLKTVPGLGDISIPGLIAEIGVDMTRFPTPGHLRSWATLCPRLDESAGKHRSTRIRPGGTWIKPLLIQCAWAGIRTKGYYRAQYERIKRRRGAKKAIVAVAASILTAVHCILSDGVVYRELGANYFERNDAARQARRLTRKLEGLGYKVQIEVAA